MNLDYFSNKDALISYLEDNAKGSLLIEYQNCEGYPGMVLGIMIVFDTTKSKYELDLQWMCFGLDFYGDTLQESYLYQFENLQKLLRYLVEKYNIDVTDIPVKYKIDLSQFPDPLKDKIHKNLYEKTWNQFQLDFKKGLFLDSSLKLNYSSLEN